MGCSASKRTQGQVISVRINAGPTVSSSGLQAASDGNINSNLLEGSQVDKEKGFGLSTSYQSSPVADTELQPVKFEQAVSDKLPTVNLPPKDHNYPEISFKRSDESSVEKDRETGPNNPLNLGLSGSGFDSNFKKDSKNNTTARFPNGNSLMIENRNSDRNPILADISNSSLPNSLLIEGKPNGNEDVNSCQKRNVDMAGLAFSFMNVKFDNSSQPNIFYSENSNQMTVQSDTKTTQNPFTNPFNARFSFAAPKESDKDTHDDKLMALSEVSSLSCDSTARGNLDHRGSGEFPRLSHDSRVPSPQKMPQNNITIINSLNVKLPEEEEKRKMSLLSTQNEQGGNSSTHFGSSLGTIVSLGNVCKDEAKKVAMSMRFTRNLLDLVKPQTSNNMMSSSRNIESLKGFSAKSLNTIGDIPEEMAGSKGSLHMSGKIASASTVMVGSKSRISSRTRLDMRANLIDLAREDDEEDEEEEDDLMTRKATSTTIKGESGEKRRDNINSHRSIELQNLDMEDEDIIQEEAPSSIIYNGAQTSMNNWTRTNTPNNLLLSRANSSFSRVDGSTILDKTIYNLEDNITRLDLDKYSIYEQIENVEVDERNNISGNDNISINRILDYKGLNTSRNQGDTSGFLGKARSEIFDTQAQTEGTTAVPTRAFLRMRPKSICEVDKGKVHDTSGTFLSPAMIPMQSLNNLPTERPTRRDFYKASSTTVIETRQVDKSVDDEGQKKINQYLLIKDLGRGGFGKVKLALHSETKAQYAIKIANKHRLKKKLLTKSKSAYTQLATEIAIMKKMDHPNIVRLFEVIDDPNNDNLYLTMEYIKKGSVLSRTFWKYEHKAQGTNYTDSSDNIRNLRLGEEKAKKYFRHLLLALDYLHNTVGIIHRDIKPENLLISEDDILKVSDFGISKIMEGDDDLLENSAGTKLYLAPESWKGKSFKGKPADIWAAGGTLYYFMFGRPPFQGLTADDVKRKILEKEVEFPEDHNVNPEIIELIKTCLIKDPEQRITLDELMQNKWLTDDGMNPLINNVGADLTLNDDDISKALTKISFMAAIMVTAKVKRRANIARLNVERKKSQTLQLPANEGGQKP